MKLHIYHGRTDPEQDMDEGWGFDGPTLEGVVGYRWTYDATHAVCFESTEACEVARKATGWTDSVHENSLEMVTHEDMVRIYNADKERWEWFGDWSLGFER